MAHPADDEEMIREEIRCARIEIQARMEAPRDFDDIELAREALASLYTCDDWLREHLGEPEEEETSPQEEALT